MYHHEVSSDTIKSIAYYPNQSVLEIELRHPSLNEGPVLEFFKVPKTVYLSLMRSHPMAAFYEKEIKPKFRYQTKSGLSKRSSF